MSRTAAIFCLLLVLILSLKSLAENPLQRACRTTQGEFQAFNFSDLNDQFLFCKYSHLALVDGGSVMSRLNGVNTLALGAYKANYDQDQNTCVSNEGRITKGVNLEGREVLFCYFEDMSIMELSTINGGINSAKNKALNRSLRF